MLSANPILPSLETKPEELIVEIAAVRERRDMPAPLSDASCITSAIALSEVAVALQVVENWGSSRSLGMDLQVRTHCGQRCEA